MFLHLWVVGRVVGAWVVPTVPTVVAVRYLMCVISIISPTNFLLLDQNFSHLSGAVSMGAGVGGLALAAAVAPRAVTSLGLGGDGGLCNNKSGLRRRIVQMLKNVYKICLEYQMLQLRIKRCKKEAFMQI